MPNWCSNNVTISHESPLLIRQVSKAFEADKLLQTFFPQPTELNDTVSPSDTPNWKDWRTEHWGTKWDISEGTLVAVSSTEVNLAFDSAWSPPIEALQGFEKLGFKIDASYIEPGMMFYGTYSNGEDNCSDYDDHSDIPDDMVDQFGLEDFISQMD